MDEVDPLCLAAERSGSVSLPQRGSVLKLGKPLSTLIYADWRKVEDDLFGIAKKVTEYDDKAILVRQDETGHFGLARFIRAKDIPEGGAYMVVHRFKDEKGNPLDGDEPDQRILNRQRETDAYLQDSKRWVRASEMAMEAERQARARQLREEMAEKVKDMMVHNRLSRHKSGILLPPGVVA